jgi:hypothetical protein
MGVFVATLAIYFGITAIWGWHIAVAWSLGFICASLLAFWEAGATKRQNP